MTLNAMLARIDAAFDRERAFTADASHELRTPLSTLKAEVDLALDGSRPRAELEAALRSAAVEIDRLVRLSEDLLVLARADERRLSVSVAPVDLGDLADRVTGRFAQQAAAQGRRLETDAEGVRVAADPLRLEQLLSNLIDNALRHGAGAVGVRVVRRDGAVELHVTDEGAGFEDGIQATAFDRFAKGASNRPGAGLGLAIVAAIAQAHGGTAHAANRPGGGADVWVSLPADGSSSSHRDPATMGT